MLAELKCIRIAIMKIKPKKVILIIIIILIKLKISKNVKKKNIKFILLIRLILPTMQIYSS